MKQNVINNQQGHTLIETVIALAILVAVLVPLSQLLVRLTHADKARDLIIASQLAREKMEQTIANKEYNPSEDVIKINNKEWHIFRVVNNQSNLIELHIKVHKKSDLKSIFELKTLRLQNERM